MANRSILVLPAVLGSVSSCCTWLQQAAGPAAAVATEGTRRAVASAAALREYESVVTLQRPDLPPQWEPPPHNPVSLKPKPPPTLPDILAKIQQASSALEIHNAYRRNSGCMPPPVAAAMYTRLSQLLPVASPSAPAIDSLERKPQDSKQAWLKARKQARRRRGLGDLLNYIRKSWHAFLHLTPARNLAALIRASAEMRLLQPANDATPMVAEAANMLAYNVAPEQAPGVEADGNAATSVMLDSDLVLRSLAVLLDCDARELAEAGPQAVLDVSYGLMLEGHEDPVTWRTLGPLLRTTKDLLPEVATPTEGLDAEATASPPPRELAAKVLTWLQEKELLQAA